MRKVSTITINGNPWTEEKLVNYASQKFGLPVKMNLSGYRLNRILCYNTMANLHDRNITLEELDNFLVTEYKKLLLQEKENLENTSEKTENTSKKF